MIKRTIQKYHIPFPIRCGEPSVVELPHMGDVLDIAIKNDNLYCWVEYRWIDGQEKLMVNNRFLIYSDGEDIPDDDNIKFCKTIHDDHNLVYHIYRYEI